VSAEEPLAPVLGPELPMLELPPLPLPVVELSDEPPMLELPEEVPEDAPVLPPLVPLALPPPCAQAAVATPSRAAVTAAPSVFIFTIRSPEWLGRNCSRAAASAMPAIPDHAYAEASEKPQ
jgi:hypothetical protein